MGKPRKLSAADMEGATVIDVAPKSVAPRKLSTEEMAGAVQVTDEPGILTSVGRGVAASLTFGFADEIVGAVESAVTGKSYRQARDESRAKFREAKAANPIAYGVGSIGGALVPGLGAVKAAKAGVGALRAGLQAAKVGAGYGAASGLGTSEADLAGGDVGGALRDTAKGAAGGAVISGAVGTAARGVGNYVRGAPERVAARTVKDIPHGDATAKLSTAKRVSHVAGEGGEDLQAILKETPDLRRTLATQAVGNPGGAAKKLAARLSKENDELNEIYPALDAKQGLPLAQFTDDMARIAEDLAKRGHDRAATVVEGLSERYARRYGRKPDGSLKEFATIPASTLRGIKKELGDAAFKPQPGTPPTASVSAQRKAYAAADDMIERLAPPEQLARLRKLNKSVSTLIPVSQALEERALKESVGRFSLYKRYAEAGGPGVGAIGYGVMSGSVPAGIGAALAGYAAILASKAGRRGVREADYLLATRLVEKARAGDKAAIRTLSQMDRLGGGAARAGGVVGGAQAAGSVRAGFLDDDEAEEYARSLGER